MAKPSVSILIDTYNHERFIEKAIVSVLEQDFPAAEREILVVDDGSTDRTPEIVRKFEPQVRLLRKRNGGQASAFNAGIPECRGEIVAFLDGDDWWALKKLSSVVHAMAADASVGIVGHGIVIVGRDGGEQSIMLGEGFRFQANTIEGGMLFRRRGAFLGTSRMAIRTELLRRIGAVPEAIKIQADEYLFTLASALTEAQILPRALTYYRLHDANNFQITDKPEPQKLRHKLKSLETIDKSLSQKLMELGIDEAVIRTVLAFTHVSADQLRLSLDGGWPWETVKTEWTLYRILHPDARFSRQMFKALLLLGALVTSPRGFYRLQTALTQNSLYRRARERWLPFTEMQHVQRGGRAGS
jgi:glycosyltransferase involved in cell wall biosynthesis